jgi:hypothetical protein
VNLLRSFAIACAIVAGFWMALGALHLLFDYAGGVIGTTVLVLVMLTGVIWISLDDGS